MLFIPTAVSVFSLLLAYFLRKQKKNQKIKQLSSGLFVAGLALFFVSSLYSAFRSLWVLLALAFVVGIVIILDRQGRRLKNLPGASIVIFQTFITALVSAILLLNLSFPNGASASIFPFYLAGLSLLTFAFFAFFLKFSGRPLSPVFYFGLITAVFFAGLLLLSLRSSQELAIGAFEIFGFVAGGWLLALVALASRFFKKAAAALPVFLVLLTAFAGFWLGGFLSFSLILLGFLALAAPIVAFNTYNSVNLDFRAYAVVFGSLASLALVFAYIGIMPGFEFIWWGLKSLIGLFLGLVAAFYLVFEKSLLGEKTMPERVLFTLILLLLAGLALGSEALISLLFGAIILSAFLAPFSGKDKAVFAVASINTLSIFALLAFGFLLL